MELVEEFIEIIPDENKFKIYPYHIIESFFKIDNFITELVWQFHNAERDPSATLFKSDFIKELASPFSYESYLKSPHYYYVYDLIKKDKQFIGFTDQQQFIIIVLLRLLEILKIDMNSTETSRVIFYLFEKVMEAVRFLYSNYEKIRSEELNTVID